MHVETTPCLVLAKEEVPAPTGFQQHCACVLTTALLSYVWLSEAADDLYVVTRSILGYWLGV